MYGVLPGGVFDGAPLTPPRGVVKSTPGNHQLNASASGAGAPKRQPHACRDWPGEAPSAKTPLPWCMQAGLPFANTQVNVTQLYL